MCPRNVRSPKNVKRGLINMALHDKSVDQGGRPTKVYTIPSPKRHFKMGGVMKTVYDLFVGPYGVKADVMKKPDMSSSQN